MALPKHAKDNLSEAKLCEAVPSAGSFPGGAGLSHFWAQELIGADLVSDLLNQDSHTSVDVAVLEDMERNHAAKVTHLISSAPRSPTLPSVSVANPLKVHALDGGFNPPPPSAKITSSIYPFTKNLPALPRHLRVINISRPLPTTQDEGYVSRATFLEKRFSELSNINNGVSIVTSAGNQHLGGEEISPLKYNPQIIAVGNLSPSGLIHATSDSDAHVFVLAPAGNSYQLSQNASGDYEGFGGTSGATPMVSSLVASLYSINPNFNNDIVKKIISSTANPTLANIHDKNANGYGLINAPKAIVLAQKITEQCQNLSQEDQGRCYLSKLNDSSFFNEPSSNNLKASMATSKQIWPSCDADSGVSVSGLQSVTSTACEKAQAIKKLRHDILLEANDSVVKSRGLRMLACIYGIEGFSENSHLYEALALATDIHNGTSKESKIRDFSISMFHETLLDESKQSALREIIEHWPDSVSKLSFDSPQNTQAFLGYFWQLRAERGNIKLEEVQLQPLLRNHLNGISIEKHPLDTSNVDNIFVTALNRAIGKKANIVFLKKAFQQSNNATDKERLTKLIIIAAST